MKKLSRQEIERKVNDILVDKLEIGYSEIENEAQVNTDLNADSIDVVELVLEFEKEFYITIKDEDMCAMIEWKVGDIYDFIERMTA